MGRQSVYNNFFDEETYKEVNEDNKALLDDFILEFRQLKRSEGTISQYKSDIRIFFIYIYKRLKNKSVLELTKKTLGIILYILPKNVVFLLQDIIGCFALPALF